MESKTKVVPIFRIFDYKKTIEFYVDWLEFKVDWEHKFNENSPIDMQVSRHGIVLHLSEHHGYCTRGSKAYITIENVRALHKELCAKDYKYNKPGLEMAPWNASCMEVVDPFSNKLLITEESKK